MRATVEDSSFGPPDESAGLFMRALQADAEAATRLYASCMPTLKNWLLARMPGCEAEDLAHEALLKALRHGARFRQSGRFMPWLRSIAWHLAQKRMRGDTRRLRRERAYTEHEIRTASTAPDISAQRLAVMNACLASLPERQRQLLHLRYIDGLSSNAIAAKCGGTRVAVAVSLHRICKELRANTLRSLLITHSSARSTHLASSRSKG